jgi:hypothetical protein
VKKKTIYISAAVFVFLLLITIFVADPFRKLTASDLDGVVEPTTAVLKSVDVGPPYLRLEQVRPEVIARFMLACLEGRIYLYAGIVTSPEMSVSKFEKTTWNYLEIDSDEFLRGQGTNGAEVVDSAIWIIRPLDEGQTAALKKATTLSAWTEDGGDFRWGAFMSVDGVRDDVISYVEKCR